MTVKPMKTALITGGAQGLGLALTQRLISQGIDVIVVDLMPLTAPDTTNVTTIQGDITTPETHTKILQTLQGRKLDMLIHSAGISATGKFQDIQLDQHRKIIDINLIAPIALTISLHAENILQYNAQVVFISSLSYFTAYPGAASYAASKDGLAHFARSWQKACPKHRVLRVFPGPLDTEHAKRYAPDNSQKSLKNRMSTDRAADIILTALRKKRNLCLPGFAAKIAAIAGTIAPRLMGRIMRKVLLDKMDRVRT